jgi:D-arabinose 1-dehydrogenase-like Zn-dependent alcohol dehydrogenase
MAGSALISPTSRKGTRSRYSAAPVGQFAIASAKIMDARVIAVDRPEDRLAMTRRRLSREVWTKEDVMVKEQPRWRAPLCRIALET